MIGNYSIVIYNVLLNYHTAYIFSPNKEEIKKILETCRAAYVNGDIVCTIEGNCNIMNVDEINKKCKKFVYNWIKRW